MLVTGKFPCPIVSPIGLTFIGKDSCQKHINLMYQSQCFFRKLSKILFLVALLLQITLQVLVLVNFSVNEYCSFFFFFFFDNLTGITGIGVDEL